MDVGSQVIRKACFFLGVVFINAVLSGTASANADQRINVNLATAAELAAALPGIGPVKAKAIVSHRDSAGQFDTPEALIDVKGIGPKTLDRLRALITIGAEQEAQAASREAATREAVRRVVAAARQHPAATQP